MIKALHRTKRERIRCAFCGGKGTDPFNVMSSRSVCSACSGQGTLEVPANRTECIYCGGSGSYKTFRCSVCEGAGVIPAAEGPTRTCPDCRGRGADGSSGLPCITCHGRGSVFQ